MCFHFNNVNTLPYLSILYELQKEHKFVAAKCYDLIFVAFAAARLQLDQLLTLQKG